MTRFTVATGLALASFALPACSDDAPAEAQPRCVAPNASELTTYAGMYELRELTLNPSGCAEPGPSILSQQTRRYVALTSEPGGSAARLRLAACAEPNDCSGSETEPLVAHLEALTCSVGDGSLYGERITTGEASSDGQCVGGSVSEGFLTRQTDGTLELRIQTRQAGPYAAASGQCTAERAQRAADGKPCTELEIATLAPWGQL